MPNRKDLLVTGEIYHVFSKSIAGFKIFNNNTDFNRIIMLLKYYKNENPPIGFSKFNRPVNERKSGIYKNVLDANPEKIVEILAYCVMSTHIHLILKQLKDNGISIFMKNILSGYSQYFNLKHKRKGPLWEGRFKNVLVETDEQLIHLSRYIHLNPVTEGLVNKPEDWKGSSYKEFLKIPYEYGNVCKYDDIIDTNQQEYKKFVEDQISYQQDLAKIKKLLNE